MTRTLKSTLALVMICALAVCFAGCGSEQEQQVQDVTTKMPDVVFETAFCTVAVPGEYGQYLTHREVIDGQITMEIFSMPMDSNDLELFRIYFGYPDSGNLLGVWNLDGEEIPVTLSVNQYGANSFSQEATAEKYYRAMEALDHVLNAIRSDSHFASKETVTVEKEDAEIEGWTFSLPGNMQWEKSETASGYRLDFYGTVKGEKYPLYCVAFGEEALETKLGIVTAGGATLAVSVQSSELPDTQGWSDSDQLELFTMMESINDVIQVITSDSSFSEDLPEELGQ